MDSEHWTGFYYRVGSREGQLLHTMWKQINHHFDPLPAKQSYDIRMSVNYACVERIFVG